MFRFAWLVVFSLSAVPLAAQTAAPKFAPVEARLVQARDGLGSFANKLKSGRPVKVAYLGGSITAAPGWRVMTRQWLAEQYPNAQIDEIHAAIGGTGSDLGVFRVEQDALMKNPDLMFVEFAVNDGSAKPEQIWRCMEGIVRKTWQANPQTDICFVYTFRVGFEKELAEGKCPNSASAMEMLADHYGIPSINFALKVVQLQKAGKLIYQADKPTDDGVIRFSQDGVHPLDDGHKIYNEVFAESFSSLAGMPAADHGTKLSKPFVEDNWEQAKMVSIDKSMLTGAWQDLPADHSLAKSFGKRMGTIWKASEAGSKLTIRFRGSLLKVYDLLGPDGGQVTVTIDGQQRAKPIPRFDSYCTYHRLATLAVAEGLDPNKEHTAVIEIHPDQPDRTPVAFRLKAPDVELKAEKYQGTNVWVGKILVLGEVVAN